MSRIFGTLGLGTFLTRRNLFKYLSRAEENKHSLLGRHFLEKARTERNSASFLSEEDLKKIDERILSLERAGDNSHLA